MTIPDFITVTLNPAIDHTVFVEGIIPGTVHRASDSQRQAGGKGINVATMLALGGAKVAVTGFLGSGNSTIFERHFRKHQLQDHFLRVEGETRTGIKIVDTANNDTTDFNLPGPAPTELQQRRLLDKLRKLAAPDRWFVIAGSLPKGLKPSYIAQMIDVIHQCNCYVAVDSSGEALKVALDAGADLAKPNQAELAEYLQTELLGFRAAMGAARELRRTTIPNLVVSLGEEGALFLTPQAELMASAPKAKVVSTVGAGDSLLAGFLQGLVAGDTPANCARQATIYAWNRLESLTPSLPTEDVQQAQMAMINVQTLAAFEVGKH
ncbi:1-phosphofructokinase family hexose kinase [Cerasicoccus arenae]|uniref:1-phosphofructokinase n=1 Tax=Cerasicoccus arenae TaxID=424488 RepID=A0A8J3DEK0_9BACT|nr:1-phosphofructokinase family hexose kinase [Cerasicoccus arenae]MBK1858299.1 1-phosphofructokinase family hexose kinase [Cerasicoccus arenae]GHB90616.1 1-phosphofructokinase [Cerasicoccus arenae]